MQRISSEKKMRILRIFLIVNGVFLFFWWPLSHWFYSDFYHHLLGFAPGSYPQSMVKIIGTCGIIPVLLLFFAAINPAKNREMIISLIIFALLIAFTYIHLIVTGAFPVYESINAAFSLFSAVFLILFYPEKNES
ncbi:MAG TPA: hypothetical protein VF857_07505 [Spirochaetota bacterium]